MIFLKNTGCIFYISVNGSIDVRSNSVVRGPDANSSSSSADGQEIEEERRAIRELLSKMQLPKVDCKVSMILSIPSC